MRPGVVAAALLATALLMATSAQAGGPDLLGEATSGWAGSVEPLTSHELADLRGEGTIEKFIELPRLHRSFERLVELDNGLVLSIVGVAGQGITISITHPRIP